MTKDTCNPAFITEEIDACDSLEVGCSSATVRVRSGSVMVRLEGIFVTLDGNAKMTTTKDQDGILHIENSGDQGIVTV